MQIKTKPHEKKLPPKDPFTQLTEEDIKNTEADLQNQNTLKTDKKCEKVLLNYLSTLPEIDNLEYWTNEMSYLDELLSKFWYNVKTSEGEYYRV